MGRSSKRFVSCPVQHVGNKKIVFFVWIPMMLGFVLMMLVKVVHECFKPKTLKRVLSLEYKTCQEGRKRWIHGGTPYIYIYIYLY